MRTNDKSRFFRRAATGTSALALATALATSPAHAQSASPSFNAPNPSVVSGSVTFDRGQTTPGVDIYNVQSPTAVLDFTPSDTTGTGTINFQNAGTTAVYQGTSNFTVLNRIVPTDPSRAIQFNGTVRSLVNSSSGGSVWFYSPGGIIAGSGAVFDVGSLLLSTGDPTGGSGTISSTTSFSLSSSNSNAAVTIQPGAQITATPEGSYVALVAPIVNQNGSVRVNGSAAYVAAEQATLSINQGLFDISVAVGSDGGGTPLVHNGTTTGPASTGAGDAQGIFMVAVPKNTAITMLIAPNGQLGFDVAGSASVENGAIYLQAGGNLSVDPVQSVVNRIVDLPQSTLGASIQIDSGNFTSPIAAQASTDLLITAGTSGITLAGDSYFYGGKQVHLVANTNGLFTADKRVVLNSFGAVPGTVQIDALAGSTMTFADLDLRADALSGRFFTSPFDVSKGGTAALRATGGAITVSGDLNLSAVGSSPDPVSTFGGNADISVSGGSITAASNTFINVSANASAASLTATAGQASVFSDAGGSAKFANLLSLNANGTGTNGTSGKGGSALLVTGLNGGSIEAVTVNLNADGIGGSAPTGTAGSGTGGDALIQAQDTTATASIKVGSATLSATGAGGDAASSGTVSGGAGAGGFARVLIGQNGSYVATGLTGLRASAEGGSGSGGGAGGNATGGNVQFSALGGTITAQTLDLSGNALAGSGGTGPATTTPGGSGGNALAGGGVSIFANGGGTITATDATLNASAIGGSGGDGFGGSGLAGAGGSATGSPAGISTSGSGQITLGLVNIRADASGGGTGSGLASSGLAGGAAQGGNTFVGAGGGTIQVTSLDLNSDARGGAGFAAGSNGGDAAGGNATIGADAGGTLKILASSSLDISANAFGGSATTGATGTVLGGKGTGGQALIYANPGGTVDSMTSFVFLDADGNGGSVSGSGNGDGTGGIGQGGNASLSAGGGTITLAHGVDLTAAGSGGSISATGTGGTGVGGVARLSTFSGASTSKIVVNGDVTLNASGSGGFASNGKGGDGLGGAPADQVNGPFDKGAYLAATGGSVSVSGAVDMDATGDGGSGSAGGGAGTGGVTNLVAFGGVIDLPGTGSIRSTGSGGDGSAGGSAGGNGTGGSSLVSASSGGDSLGGGVVPLGIPSRVAIGTLFQDASGTGGDGGTGAVGGNGGAGGDGVAGITNLIGQAGSGTLVVGNVTLSISGFGGQGGDGGAAPASGGNGGNGGRGGNGTGGFTNFGTASGPATTNNDGSATMGDVQVTVFGAGGNGGDGISGGNGGAGGTGTGGTATLLSRGAPVSTQTVSLLGYAVGGNGGAGAALGAGGDAIGGNIGLLATNRFQRTERGSLQTTSFSASAFTQAGTGSTTGASTAGQVFAEVTQADVTLDSLSLFTFGTNSPPAGSESQVVVDAGTLNVGTSLGASAAGDFRFGAVNGGVLKANSLELSATGSLLPPASGTPGTIDVATDFSATFGGDFVTTSNFDVNGSFHVDSGGQLQVGNVTSGGDVSLSGVGAVTAGNIVAVQDINLDAQGALTTGDLTAESGYGSVFLQSGGNLATGNIRSADGLVASANGTVTTGDVTAGLSTQSILLGEVDVTATGAIAMGNITAPSVDISIDSSSTTVPATIKTGDIKSERITILGSGDVQTGKLTTGDFYSNFSTEDDFLVGVAALGNITTGDIVSLDYVGLESGTGSISTGSINMGKSALLLAKTDVTTGAISGGTGTNNDVFISNASIVDSNPDFASLKLAGIFDGNFDPTVLSTATPVRLDGKVTLAGPVTTGGFAAAATGGFDTGAINAVNRLLIDSGAALALGDLTTGDALSLTSTGALSVGNVQASNVSLTSTGSVTAGAIQASGPVNVTAGSFASFTGAVGGSTISVSSADLQLGSSGRLGTASTTQLTLNANGASQVTLGGTGAAGGYTIDAAEAQGLRAQRIDINSSAPVTIATLSLNGSGAGSGANLVGDSGQLVVNTTSGIRVAGAFTLANAGTGNRVALRSGDRIAVATDSGGMIALSGSGSGSLGGTLELTGNSIAVATGSLLDQLAANPNFSGRNAALAAPASNSPNAAGVIQANRLELAATNLIAIQNTGSQAQFAGFSSGAGGMLVTSRGTSTAPLDVVIFGRSADSGGNFKMNNEALGQITFAGGEGTSGSFASAAAVNTCVIGSGCTVAPPPPPETPPPPVIAQISTSVVDTVQGSLDAAADPESVAALPTVTLITTIDTGQLRTDPLISDPVSGGGNPSLWETPDDQNDRREGNARPTPGQGDDK